MIIDNKHRTKYLVMYILQNKIFSFFMANPRRNGMLMYVYLHVLIFYLQGNKIHLGSYQPII